MGCSQLADALTGRSLPRGEPVVALVVERRTGGYPDATTHAAMAPSSPSQMFEPVSLPIRGKAGDYGDIEPRSGDLGAKILLDLANKPDWASLATEAFGYKASILLGDAAYGKEKSDIGFPVDKNPRVLGLVVFSEASWKRIVRDGSPRTSRANDVAAVLDALSTARKAVLAGDNTALGMNMDLTRLASSCLYETDPDDPEKTRTTRLPTLSRALSGREGGDLLSGMATERLRKGGVLGTRLLRQEPGPDTVRLIGMVWDLQAAERGMDLLCKTWQPSYGAGQHDNAKEVANAAIDAFSDSAAHLLDRVEEGYGDEEEIAELEGMMARLEAARAAIAGRLEALREDAPQP